MVPAKTDFRYDINALRAIAVIGVMLFHYNVLFFDGGYTGVDIFFVISGYLMSRILYNGFNKGNFSIIDFYNRRGQRIVPALLFVVLIVVAVTYFIYLPIDYKIVAKNATASLLFYSNILYTNVSYFDASSDNNIFLHSWSLSVEWQFYLILPLVFFLLHKVFKQNSLAYLLFFLFCFIVIFMGSVYLAHKKPTVAFYMLPTRSWEMLAGVIAFLAEDRLRKYAGKFIAILGYLMLLACFVLLHEKLLWPGFYTLIPVVGTFMIITANYNNFKILKVKAVQVTGKISYSLYLWHWPVVVLAGYLGVQDNKWLALVYTFISYVLALFSYTYVENYKRNSTTLVVGGVLAMTAITIAFTSYNVNEVWFSKQTLQIADYNIIHKGEYAGQFSRDTCYINSESVGHSYDKKKCLCLDEGKKNVLLLGDSHAAHFYQSLKELLKAENINMMHASSSGCMPLLATKGESRCTKIINYIFEDFVVNNAGKIDGVIISADWMSEIESEELFPEMHKTIAYLDSLHIPTVIIGQTESYSIPVPSIAAREHEYNSPVKDNYITLKSLQTNLDLKKEFTTRYIDIYRVKGIKTLSEQSVPYMFDKNHFTKFGADYYAKAIVTHPNFVRFIK